MTTSTDVRADLAEVGSRRAAAEQARASAMADLVQLVRRGHDEGVPVAEMARLAGVTRVTVYALLKDG